MTCLLRFHRLIVEACCAGGQVPPAIVLCTTPVDSLGQGSTACFHHSPPYPHYGSNSLFLPTENHSTASEIRSASGR